MGLLIMRKCEYGQLLAKELSILLGVMYFLRKLTNNAQFLI